MSVVTKFHLPKKSFLLACKICEQGNPSISHDATQNFQDEIGKLINLKAFIFNSNNWIEDDHGDYYKITHKEDDKVGYVNKNQELIMVNCQSTMVYKINFDWLINVVRNDLEVTQHPSDILIDDLFWQIGILQSEAPIFFARRLSNKTIFENIYKSLEAKKGIKKGIILTTSSGIPFGCSRLLGHEVITLKDCLVYDNKNFKIDQDILKKAIGIKVESDKKEGFSAGYRTAYIKGVEYNFSKKQAAIIEALDKNGGKMNKYELLADADSEQYDVYRLFKDNKGQYHPAWDDLIKHDGKGNYWLDC